MSQQQEQTVFEETAAVMNPTKKFVVAPMRYDLMIITQDQALMTIASLTRGFHDLPFEFAQWMQYDIRSRPYTTFGYIPAPPNEAIVKKIIGYKGHYLKLTTQRHRVDFIWHNAGTNQFHFWGDRMCCIRAMNEIRYRICKLVEGHLDPEIEQETKEFHEARAATQEARAATQEARATQEAAAETAPVFLNDTQQDPSVCLEAILTLDINDEITAVNSKYYP
uniref:Uncharacterized protein n=1 Tax=viral metagenome TaxID=1070528 RepID=A0A6C0IIB0_9ZZZZ